MGFTHLFKKNILILAKQNPCCYLRHTKKIKQIRKVNKTIHKDKPGNRK